MKISKQTINTWWTITKERFPIIFMETTGYLTYLALKLLILYAHVLVLVVLVLQLAGMLLLTIGCLPLLILSWVRSNLTYSGEKTHQASLQISEDRLLKNSERLQKSVDTLSQYIKRSLSFMD